MSDCIPPKDFNRPAPKNTWEEARNDAFNSASPQCGAERRSVQNCASGQTLDLQTGTLYKSAAESSSYQVSYNETNAAAAIQEATRRGTPIVSLHVGKEGLNQKTAEAIKALSPYITFVVQDAEKARTQRQSLMPTNNYWASANFAGARGDTNNISHKNSLVALFDARSYNPANPIAFKDKARESGPNIDLMQFVRKNNIVAKETLDKLGLPESTAEKKASARKETPARTEDPPSTAFSEQKIGEAIKDARDNCRRIFAIASSDGKISAETKKQMESLKDDFTFVTINNKKANDRMNGGMEPSQFWALSNMRGSAGDLNRHQANFMGVFDPNSLIGTEVKKSRPIAESTDPEFNLKSFIKNNKLSSSDVADTSPPATDTSTKTPVDTSVPTDTSTKAPVDTSSKAPTDTATKTPADTSTPTDTATKAPVDTSSKAPTDTATKTPPDALNGKSVEKLVPLPNIDDEIIVGSPEYLRAKQQRERRVEQEVTSKGDTKTTAESDSSEKIESKKTEIKSVKTPQEAEQLIAEAKRLGKPLAIFDPLNCHKKQCFQEKPKADTLDKLEKGTLVLELPHGGFKDGVTPGSDLANIQDRIAKDLEVAKNGPQKQPLGVYKITFDQKAGTQLTNITPRPVPNTAEKSSTTIKFETKSDLASQAKNSQQEKVVPKDSRIEKGDSKPVKLDQLQFTTKDTAKAFELARKHNLPVVVYKGSDGCGNCPPVHSAVERLTGELKSDKTTKAIVLMLNYQEALKLRKGTDENARLLNSLMPDGQGCPDVKAHDPYNPLIALKDSNHYAAEMDFLRGLVPLGQKAVNESAAKLPAPQAGGNETAPAPIQNKETALPSSNKETSLPGGIYIPPQTKRNTSGFPTSNNNEQSQIKRQTSGLPASNNNEQSQIKRDTNPVSDRQEARVEAKELPLSKSVKEAHDRLLSLAKDNMKETNYKRLEEMMTGFEERMSDRIVARTAAKQESPEEIKAAVNASVTQAYDSLSKMIGKKDSDTFYSHETRVKLAENMLYHLMDPTTVNQGMQNNGEPQSSHGSCWEQVGQIWGMIQHPGAMTDLLAQVSLNGSYTTKNDGPNNPAPQTHNFKPDYLTFAKKWQEGRWTIERASSGNETTERFGRSWLVGQQPIPAIWEEDEKLNAGTRNISTDRSPVSFIFDSVMPVIGHRKQERKYIDAGHYQDLRPTRRDGAGNLVQAEETNDGLLAGTSTIMHRITGDMPLDEAYTNPQTKLTTGVGTLLKGDKRLTLLEKGSVLKYAEEGRHSVSEHLVRVKLPAESLALLKNNPQIPQSVKDAAQNGKVWAVVADDQTKDEKTQRSPDKIIAIIPDLAKWVGKKQNSEYSVSIPARRRLLPGSPNDYVGNVTPRGVKK